VSTFPVNKSSSLKNTSEIDAVFKDGSKLSSKLISLYYVKSKKENPLRAAFSVGKKTHNLAVNRNKIKRLMREAFRLNIEKYNIVSCDLVFVYFSQDIASYEEVKNSIKSLLLSLTKTIES